MIQVRPPVPNQDDAFFWDGARQGKLLLQRCAECGTVRHPPAPMCGTCGSLATDALECSGRGTVHSWILSHHPTEPDEAPRVVVLVDLEEGHRLVSNLVDTSPDEIHNGMAVDVCFVECTTTDGGTITLPQFLPAGRTATDR